MPWSQLHVAAETGDVAKAKALLDGGVNLEDRDDGDQTALHRAAGFGHANIVEFLLDSNGKVDDADESGSTPLHLASWRGQVDVVNLLLDRGAAINARGMYGDTALHLASSYGQKEACVALIERKADINARDNGGKTPLDWATEASQTDIATLLEANDGVSAASQSAAETVSLWQISVIIPVFWTAATRHCSSILGVQSAPMPFVCLWVSPIELTLPRARACARVRVGNDPKAPTVEANQEFLMKVLVVGDTGTGKTSFIKRYVHNTFSESYKATIGVDFALKSLQFKNVLVRLQLWDIAGQERFGAMTHVYYKEAVGAIVAFDSTRPDTFESVLKWKNDLDDKIALPDDSPIPVLLLATKCDLVSGTDSDATSGLSQTNAKLATFVTEHKFAGHAMISSKTGLGVDAAAKFLVQHIVDATASFNAVEPDPNAIQLSSKPDDKGCCA
eukprot:m.84581 g.84581  ORF g.84581 m.84581 type:complete len:447 (-) comp19727_c0_seq5:29-1369(-)